jgi:hypothetical protein
MESAAAVAAVNGDKGDGQEHSVSMGHAHALLSGWTMPTSAMAAIMAKAT